MSIAAGRVVGHAADVDLLALVVRVDGLGGHDPRHVADGAALRRERIGAGELEDAAHQAVEALGVGQDVGEELPPLLLRHVVEMIAQQLGAAPDAGERRLELVADAERAGRARTRFAPRACAPW